MKLNRKRDLKKCGIYCIRNIINNKVYIGKSINIYERLKQHVTSLNRGIITQENTYFINGWKKYKSDSFEYFVLEYVDNTIDEYENTLKEKELYWMKYYNSLDIKHGYNIRYDSKTNTKVNSLTRLQQSINMKNRWKNNRETMITSIKNNWKVRSIESLNNMKLLLSELKTKYYFSQFDKNYNFIRDYNTMKELLEINPTYKRGGVYSVCSGEKPSMYNYIWKKTLKKI